MSAELLARARAVVARDERTARNAAYSPVGTEREPKWISAAIGAAGEHGVGANLERVGGWVVARTTIIGGRYASHIAAWGPDRVLRLCASRRALLDRYETLLAALADYQTRDPDAEVDDDDDEAILDEAGYCVAVAACEEMERQVQAIVDEEGR